MLCEPPLKTMDRIIQYKTILREILNEQLSYGASDMPEVYNQAIVSEDENHFQLIVLGWYHNKYVYNLAFHLELREGKVWVHEDKTDAGIADRLVERGIISSDIVLGFGAPYSRPEAVSVP